ncbi:uncharacterized protein LOC108893244 [Lates calcarifer]|uniref:Uncharacterized protein LOC108893244 n=1 Tax=Lates calcarifer TaxID=8187 RepID=A0AAJ7VCJ3_LATCA|nr:uncharacterized protein LOC108893244 [Lates calcarifer]
MDKSKNSEGKSLKQMQPEDAAQQYGHTFSEMLDDLRQALLDSKKENKDLAAENAVLREQMASLVSTLSMTRDDLVNLVKSVGCSSAKEKQMDGKNKEMDRRLKKMEEKVNSLKESLHLQQAENARVKKLWKEECDKVKEMELSFHNAILEVNAEWESRWVVRQEEAAVDFQAVQESCEEKIRKIIKEKDDMFAGAKSEKLALEEQVKILTTLRTIEMEILLS